MLRLIKRAIKIKFKFVRIISHYSVELNKKIDEKGCGNEIINRNLTTLTLTKEIVDLI